MFRAEISISVTLRWKVLGFFFPLSGRATKNIAPAMDLPAFCVGDPPGQLKTFILCLDSMQTTERGPLLSIQIEGGWYILSV